MASPRPDRRPSRLPTGSCSGRGWPCRLRPALAGVGQMKVEDRLQAAREVLFEVRPESGREDDDARKILDALQEIGKLLIGETTMGVLHFGSLAEERVGL